MRWTSDDVMNVQMRKSVESSKRDKKMNEVSGIEFYLRC